MKEIALNVLDLAENSLRANATRVEIDISVRDDFITLQIVDDGCGMDPEFVKRVTDPYATTRTTRNVGLGIPLTKMEAEMSGGGLTIESELGVGTKLTATFAVNNIDRPPLGNLGETIVALIPDLGKTELIFRYRAFGGEFVLDTSEIQQQLQGIPMDSPEVLVFLRQLTEENIMTINGGIIL